MRQSWCRWVLTRNMRPFTDAITIFGTDSGILEFNVYASNVNDRIGDFVMIGGQNSFSVGGGPLQSIEPFPNKFSPWNTFTIPFQPGVPIAFAARSQASANLNYIFDAVPNGYGVSASLILSSIRVMDLDGNDYTSFSYQTDSHTNYNVVNGTSLSSTVGISAVPEPSTGLLIAGAAPLLLLLRRKQGRG